MTLSSRGAQSESGDEGSAVPPALRLRIPWDPSAGVPANEQQALTEAFPWGRRQTVGVTGKRSTRQVIAQGDPRCARVGTRNDTFDSRSFVWPGDEGSAVPPALRLRIPRDPSTRSPS